MNDWCAGVGWLLLLFLLGPVIGSPQDLAGHWDRPNLVWIRSSLVDGSAALRQLLSAIDQPPADDSVADQQMPGVSGWTKVYGQCCSSHGRLTRPWCRRRRLCPSCVESDHRGDLHRASLDQKYDAGDAGGASDPGCLTYLGRHLNSNANTCCVSSLFDNVDRPSHCDCLAANLLNSDSSMSIAGPSTPFQQADVLLRDMPDLPAAFSVLLNFGTDGYWQFLMSLQNVKGHNECDDHAIWDPFANLCIPVYCSPHPTDQRSPSKICITENPVAPTDKDFVIASDVVHIVVYANVDRQMVAMDEEALMATVEASFLDEFCHFLGISRDRVSNLSVTIAAHEVWTAGEDTNWNDTSSSMATLEVGFWLKEKSDHSTEPSTDLVMAMIGSIVFQDQLVSIVGGVPFQVVGIHEQPVLIQDTDMENAWCNEGYRATYSIDDVIMEGPENNATDGTANKTLYRVYVKPTETWYETSQFTANLLLRVGRGSPATDSLTGHVEVCENRSTAISRNCHTVYLNESEFVYLGNGSVHYSGSVPFVRPVLTWGSYKHYPDGRVAVCLDLDYLNVPLALVIETYLSLVLTSISCGAMLITIGTYLLFSELRNLPGLTILNLTVSKFVFQLTFMLGMRESVHQNAALCLAVAVLVHYEGLAAFFWSNVMATDLYLTFGRRITGAPRHSTKIFPRYALYAYGLPLLIVSTSLSLFYCDCTGSFTIGYAQYTCWIGQPSASFLFFGLPLTLALAVNLVLFLITVRSIRRVSGSVRSSERHSRKNQVVQELWMFVRMCTVMGFTWLFGLLASFMEIITMPGLIITYIFVIASALEGLFIFVAFTCNHRIGRLYCRLLRLQEPRGDSRRYAPDVPTITFTAPEPIKTASVETLVTSTASSDDQTDRNCAG